MVGRLGTVSNIPIRAVRNELEGRSVPVSRTVEPASQPASQPAGRPWIWQPLLLSLLHGSNVVGGVLPVNRANRCCRKVLPGPGYVIPRDSSRLVKLSALALCVCVLCSCLTRSIVCACACACVCACLPACLPACERERDDRHDSSRAFLVTESV